MNISKPQLDRFISLCVPMKKFYWTYNPKLFFKYHDPSKKDLPIRLGDSEVRKHLMGETVLGLSPFMEGEYDKVKYGAIDLDAHGFTLGQRKNLLEELGDEKKVDEAEQEFLKKELKNLKEDLPKLTNELDRLGYAYFVNSSGSAGKHIRVYGKNPTNAKVMMYFLKDLQQRILGEERHEVFPKQEGLNEKTPFGNQMKAVLAIHPKTGNLAGLIDDDGSVLNVGDSLLVLDTFHSRLKDAKDINFEIIKEHEKKYKKIKFNSELLLEGTYDIPNYCGFFEEVACKLPLPSGKCNRHEYLDGNAFKYLSNKPNEFKEYCEMQGRDDSAFNNCEEWKFSCDTIAKYLRNNEGKSIQVAINICQKCILSKKDNTSQELDEEIDGFTEATHEVKIIDALKKIKKIDGEITRNKLIKKIMNKTKIDKKVLEKEFKKVKISMKKVITKIKEIDNKFYKNDLLNNIHLELDKKHKLDHKEKLALFLIAVSGELPDPDDHCSAAVKGDSSSGKDNAIKTALGMFPEADNFFLTRGTSAAIEDEAEKVKRIAFSEINKHRENGANNDITETFKQFAEGGINVIKKDPETGFSTTKQTKTEQKTLFYGTTDTQTDDELETRYVVVPISGYAKKNQVVVNNVLDNVNNQDYYIKKLKENQNWVADGIEQLDNSIQVLIPFANIFKNKILDDDGKEKYLFDYTKERIKRDAKRLLSLTKAITWLYQKQRITFENSGQKFVYAEPSDFTTALTIFADFFNLTYSGLDHRLQKTLECIKANVGKHKNHITKAKIPVEYSNWVLRHKIQEELGIDSRNTIKGHIKKLTDFGQIETYFDPTNNKHFLISPVNSPISKVSLPVSLIAIDRSLTGWLTGGKSENIYNNHEIKKIILNILDDKLNKLHKKISVSETEIDGSEIDGSIPLRNTQGFTVKKTIKNQMGEFELCEPYHAPCSICGEISVEGWRYIDLKFGLPYCYSCIGLESPLVLDNGDVL